MPHHRISKKLKTLSKMIIWELGDKRCGSTRAAGPAQKPPTAPILGWDPGTPEVGQDLACIVLVDSTDADGDAISYLYSWYLDYEEQVALAGETTVPGADVQIGDRWTCEVRADDGDTEGPLAVKEVLLAAEAVFPPLVLASDMPLTEGAIGLDLWNFFGPGPEGPSQF